MSAPSQHDRYAEAQTALLAWARDKAKHPFIFVNGSLACLFCHNLSCVTYDGAVHATHAPGCLALRAIAEGVA